MKNLTVLTGASSGIGFHIAQNIKGKVITCSRTNENIFENKDNIRHIKVDLGNKQDQIAFVDAIKTELVQGNYSGISLVLNAAVIGNEELDGTYYNEDYVWETNYFSNIYLINELRKLQLLTKIIFVSSGTVNLFEFDSRIATYVATKRAMESYILSIKNEVGIDVSIFIPGITNTRLHTSILNADPGLVTERHQSIARLNQVRNPETVAKLIIVLMKYKLLKNLLLETSYRTYTIFNFWFVTEEISLPVFYALVAGIILCLITPSYNLNFFPVL